MGLSPVFEIILLPAVLALAIVLSVKFSFARTSDNDMSAVGRQVTLVAIAGTLFAIWVWPGLRLPPLTGQESRHLYLLSAAAQSAAAVLAITFTISLVVAQLTARYSHRVAQRFFDGHTIAYISLFVVAILFSLYAIPTSDVAVVKVALSLVAIVLLWLVPFFIGFKQKLDPEQMVKLLLVEAHKELQEGRAERQSSPIRALDNTLLAASRDRDYDTAEVCIRGLIALATAAESQRQSPQAILRRIRIAVEVVAEDPKLPSVFVDAIGDLVDEAPRRHLAEFWETACTVLERMFPRACESNSELATSLAEVLGKAAVAGANTGPDYVITDRLGRVASSSLEQGKPVPARKIVAALCSAGVALAELPDDQRGEYWAKDNIYYPRPDTLDQTIMSIIQEVGKVCRQAADSGLDQPVYEAFQGLQKLGESGTDEQRQGFGEELMEEFGKSLAHSGARGLSSAVAPGAELYRSLGCWSFAQPKSPQRTLGAIAAEMTGELSSELQRTCVYQLEACLQVARTGRGDLSWATMELWKDGYGLIERGHFAAVDRLLKVLAKLGTVACQYNHGGLLFEAVDGLVKMTERLGDRDAERAAAIAGLRAIATEGCRDRIREILGEHPRESDDLERLKSKLSES